MLLRAIWDYWRLRWWITSFISTSIDSTFFTPPRFFSIILLSHFYFTTFFITIGSKGIIHPVLLINSIRWKRLFIQPGTAFSFSLSLPLFCSLSLSTPKLLRKRAAQSLARGDHERNQTWILEGILQSHSKSPSQTLVESTRKKKNCWGSIQIWAQVTHYMLKQQCGYAASSRKKRHHAVAFIVIYANCLALFLLFPCLHFNLAHPSRHLVLFFRPLQHSGNTSHVFLLLVPFNTLANEMLWLTHTNSEHLLSHSK